MFLNKIRVFLLINLHVVILLTNPENLKAKELKTITGIAKVIDGDTILINKKKIRKGRASKKIFILFKNII